MPANYICRGSRIFVGSDLDIKVTPNLPVSTYEVCFSPLEGFWLGKIPDFSLPKKLYGRTESRAKRFLETFRDRPNVTGVLLTGLKGSGKSLEMKKTACLAAELGMATIVVNDVYKGTQFNNFISSIEDPCLILFDEFEKVYDREAQEELLTLLDGTVTTKKLVIFTSNDRYRINEHMVNRPGRIFYSINYAGLESDFVREYCEENLDDKEQIDAVVRVATYLGEFNFDMLKALVEEMNRYSETVKEAIEFLNIDLDSGNGGYYDVVATHNDAQITVQQESIYNPLGQAQIRLIIKHHNDIDDECMADEPCGAITQASGNAKSDRYMIFSPSDSRTVISSDQRVITLANDNNQRLVLTRQRSLSSFDFRSYI